MRTRPPAFLLWLSLLLAALLRTVPAQSATSAAADGAFGPLVPAAGLWWEFGRNGNFWSIDVGPGGFAFVQLSTFDAQRQPIFLVMQGQLETISGAPDRPGAVLRLRSPLYALAGGQCLGCAFQPAGVSPSAFGDAELLFDSADRAQFRWQAQRTEIGRFPLYLRATDTLQARLPGNYLLDWTDPHGLRASTFVVVQPAAPGSPLFSVFCQSGNYCPPLGFADAGSGVSSDQLGQMLTGLQLQASADRLQASYRPPGDLQRCHPRTCICLSGRVPVGNGWCALPDADPTRYPLDASGEGDGQIVLAGAATSGLGTLRLRPSPVHEPAQLEAEQRGAPQRGLWWENGRNGQFWSIDTGPGGYLFVNFGTFDAQGKATFLTMQGQFEPAAAGANAGWLRSPLYRLSGGTCLGCSFQPAVVSPSELGEGAIEFRSSQEAVFHWQGQQFVISRFPLYNRAQDAPTQRLAGFYTLRTSLGVSAGFARAQVELFDTPPRCPVAAGTRVLAMRAGERQCTGCTSNEQLPALVDQLLDSTELHVAAAGYSQLSAYRVTAGGCEPRGRFEEREGRLELRLSPAEGSRIYSLLPR